MAKRLYKYFLEAHLDELVLDRRAVRAAHKNRQLERRVRVNLQKLTTDKLSFLEEKALFKAFSLKAQTSFRFKTLNRVFAILGWGLSNGEAMSKPR